MTKFDRALEAVEFIKNFSVCSPCEDSITLTNVVENYRSLVWSLKINADGYLSKRCHHLLGLINPDLFEDIYDVYKAKAILDAILVDLRHVKGGRKVRRLGR
jgi:hypothetical protein